MSKESLSPILRFDGFKNEWYEFQIDDVFLKVRNGFVGTATPYYVDKGIPYLQSNNIRRNKIDKTHLVYISQDFHEKNEKSILKENDILMVQSGHAGECAVVPKKFEGSNCHALIIMSPNLSKINSIFCAYYLNSPIGIKQMFSLITGNTVKHILASEVKKMKIKLPSLKEQNKIANFLYLIDKKIELLEKNQALYEQQRDYYMNLIFGECLQNTDSNQFKLKNVCEKIENGFSGQQVPFETNYPVTRIETMSSGKINYDKVGFVEEIDERYRLREGDILLTNINSLKWIGNVVYFEDEKPLYHGMNLMLLRPKQEFNSKYIYYYITFHNKWFKKMACQAVNQASINKSTLEKFTVLVPKLEIQEGIANLLTNIDKKLILSEKNIMLMAKFKKGLLQKMFI